MFHVKHPFFIESSAGKGNARKSDVSPICGSSSRSKQSSAKILSDIEHMFLLSSLQAGSLGELEEIRRSLPFARHRAAW
jgi:hypothetical protein